MVLTDEKRALLGDHEAAKLTHLSLFSGIGGLDLAAEMAGFRTVGQCEWADYPTKVLEKHWPDVPRWRDIRTLTGESFYEKTGMRTVSIISGGFPCQPHSVIGKRLAENDERHLWPEFIRVVRELRPKYVVGENVNGILSTIHESVCSDLEKEGYEVWTFSIPACAVGAHHERYRVCILGISKSKPGFQADTQTNATGTQRKTRTNNVLQTWDYLPGTYWAVHQPPVCGMDDGIPDWMGGYSQYKQRMQCYGNAVVPQQFYPIFQAIADIERGIIIEAKKTDPGTGPFSEWLAEYLVDHLPTLTPPNDPLTIEQLREMDGEPVWIVEPPDWGHWELSADAEDYIEDRDQDLYGLKHDDPAGQCGLHVLGWLAYRRPPEGGEINKITVVQYLGRLEDVAFRPVSRELVEKVWPGCDFCNTADFGEFGFEITKHYAKICCALGSWRFPEKEQFLFCPKCGKPLTDEAVEMVMERLEALKDGDLE